MPRPNRRLAKAKEKSSLDYKITMTREISIAGAKIGGNNPPLIMAGPCVIENEDITFNTAKNLKSYVQQPPFRLFSKSSYDKANRTSIKSFRGPGMEKGLRMLADIKSRLDIPVITDVHSIEEIKPASEGL